MKTIGIHAQVDKHLVFDQGGVGFKDPHDFQVQSRGFVKLDEGAIVYPVDKMERYVPFNVAAGYSPYGTVEVGGPPPGQTFAFIQQYKSTPTEAFYQVNMQLALPIPKWALAALSWPAAVNFNLVVLCQASRPGEPKSTGSDIVLTTDVSQVITNAVANTIATTMIVRNNMNYWRYVLAAYGVLSKRYATSPHVIVDVAFRKSYHNGAMGEYGAEEFHVNYDMAVYASGESLRPLFGLTYTPEQPPSERGGRKTPTKKTLPSRRGSI